MKKQHTNAIAGIRARLKAEKCDKAIKVGSVGYFFDVTELKFRGGGSPYERDAKGTIRKTTSGKIRTGMR